MKEYRWILKKFFEEATTLEQLLFGPIIPVMSIERLSSGHLKNTGYCALFKIYNHYAPCCLDYQQKYLF